LTRKTAVRPPSGGGVEDALGDRPRACIRTRRGRAGKEAPSETQIGHNLPIGLVAHDGGSEISLTLLVGRHPGCAARMDSPRVCGRHRSLSPELGGLRVRVLASIDGTRINGRGIVSRRLRLGDELKMTIVRLLLPEGPTLA
jgi:FHA domain